MTDEEVATIRSDTAQPTSACDDNVASPSLPSMTEGMIYNVPPHLTEECLSELDFREKGGYSRDVIDVLDDTTGEKVRALLYRGGPDNPAFWRRALLDLPYAAGKKNELRISLFYCRAFF